jgi:hypothetical protein
MKTLNLKFNILNRKPTCYKIEALKEIGFLKTIEQIE